MCCSRIRRETTTVPSNADGRARSDRLSFDGACGCGAWCSSGRRLHRAESRGVPGGCFDTAILLVGELGARRHRHSTRAGWISHPSTPRAPLSGQATLTIPAGAATGTYYVIADADSLKVVPESSENNNATSRAVRIGGDLVISTFDAPAAGGVGVPFTIGDTTKNTGASPIGASVTHFYLSADAVLTAIDPLLGTRSVGALAADQASVGTTTVTIPAGTAAGYYYLVCQGGRPEPGDRNAGGEQRSDTIVRRSGRT